MCTDAHILLWPSTSPVPGRDCPPDDDIRGGERDTMLLTAVFSTTPIICLSVSKILGVHAKQSLRGATL